MRALPVLAVFAALVTPRLAAADPTSRACYAGTQTLVVGTTTTKQAFVMERTNDPKASEIRQRGWSAKDPEHEVTTRLKVDVKAGTFEVVEAPKGATGSGTLKGKPWSWTSAHGTLTLEVMGQKIESVGDSVFSAKKMTTKQVLKKDGKVVGSETGEATAFDCKDLEARRAALAKP